MGTTSNAEAQAAQGRPLAGQLRSELFLSADHIDCISPDLLEAAPSFLTAWAKTSTTTGYFVRPDSLSLSLSEAIVWGPRSPTDLLFAISQPGDHCHCGLSLLGC